MRRKKSKVDSRKLKARRCRIAAAKTEGVMRQSKQLIPVEIHGVSVTVPSLGLPIPKAPHFVVTERYIRQHVKPTLKAIKRYPALTHRLTGLRVSQTLLSVEQAAKIAVVLEALPIPWEASQDEMLRSLNTLPDPLRRWLYVEVCGYCKSRVPSPENYRRRDESRF